MVVVWWHDDLLSWRNMFSLDDFINTLWQRYGDTMTPSYHVGTCSHWMTSPIPYGGGMVTRRPPVLEEHVLIGWLHQYLMIAVWWHDDPLLSCRNMFSLDDFTNTLWWWYGDTTTSCPGGTCSHWMTSSIPYDSGMVTRWPPPCHVGTCSHWMTPLKVEMKTSCLVANVFIGHLGNPKYIYQHIRGW